MADLRGRVPGTPANSLWGLGGHGPQQPESLTEPRWENRVRTDECPQCRSWVRPSTFLAFDGQLPQTRVLGRRVKTGAVHGAGLGVATPSVLGPPIRPVQLCPSSNARVRQPPTCFLPAPPP